MNRTRRAFAVALVLLCAAPALEGRQQPSVAPVTLSNEEMTAFLRKAAITKRRTADKGTTNTVRATLSDGRITHDAQFQTVDVAMSIFTAGKASETNFKDSWRYNIGGYQLARLLGMNNVPMSVKRVFDGKDGAVTDRDLEGIEPIRLAGEIGRHATLVLEAPVERHPAQAPLEVDGRVDAEAPQIMARDRVHQMREPMAAVIGDAPRKAGNKLACTLMQP